MQVGKLAPAQLLVDAHFCPLLQADQRPCEHTGAHRHVFVPGLVGAGAALGKGLAR